MTRTQRIAVEQALALITASIDGLTNLDVRGIAGPTHQACTAQDLLKDSLRTKHKTARKAGAT